MHRLLISAALGLALSGCSDGAQRLRGQVALGTSGYTGALRPIEGSVQLSYGPVRSYRRATETFVRRHDGSEKYSAYTEIGEIREMDSNLLWTIRIDSMADGQSAWSPDIPIAEIEFWTDKAGRMLGDPGAKFPAFDRAGRMPKADEIAAFKAEINSLTRLSPAVARSYKHNEEVVPGRFFRAILQASNPGAVVDSSDMSLRATGIASFFGRPALFTEFSGVGRLSSPRGNLTAAIQGHWAADASTGLPVSAIFRATMSGHLDGKPASAEAITVSRTTAAEFLQPPGERP